MSIASATRTVAEHPTKKPIKIFLGSAVVSN